MRMVHALDRDSRPMTVGDRCYRVDGCGSGCGMDRIERVVGVSGDGVAVLLEPRGGGRSSRGWVSARCVRRVADGVRSE